MLLRALVVWSVMALALLLNEAVRGAILLPVLSALQATIVSSVLGAALIFALAFLFVQRYPEALHRQWVWIGRMWLVLTLAFEIVHGQYISGLAWPDLFERFHLLRGWLRILVPLAALLAPGFWSRRLYPRVDARLWLRP